MFPVVWLLSRQIVCVLSSFGVSINRIEGVSCCFEYYFGVWNTFPVVLSITSACWMICFWVVLSIISADWIGFRLFWVPYRHIEYVSVWELFRHIKYVSGRFDYYFAKLKAFCVVLEYQSIRIQCVSGCFVYYFYVWNTFLVVWVSYRYIEYVFGSFWV